MSGLEQVSARADSRLKQTEAQAKKTEQAVTNAFRGSSSDPLKRLQDEFSARASKLRIDLSDIGGHATKIKQIDAQLKLLDGQVLKTGGTIKKDLNAVLDMVSPRLASIVGAVGPLTAGLLGVSAVASVGAGMFQFAKSAADAGDEIFDLTQKVNFSAETISALKNAGQSAGVEFTSISGALGIFNKNVEAANQGDKTLSRTFKALKVDIRDNETALRTAFKALLDVEDGAQQTALAMQLFGRSGKDVLGVIKETNGDLDKAIQKYRQLGTLITSETAKAANDFSDKLTALEQKFDAVARAVGERFMPTVSRAMDDVNAALDKNKATAQNWATDLVAIVEFAATQIGHILQGLSLVIEGFRKTFGKGSIVGDAIEGETKRRLLSLPDGRVMDLNTRETFDVNTEEGKARLFGQPQRWEDEGELAIPFATTPDKPKSRIAIPGSGGGGGAKAQRDVLESLRSTLISLNAEWRKWDVALLDSASASAEAAQKQSLLDNVMSSLSSKAKLAISSVRDVDEAIEKAITSLPAKSQDAARALVNESLTQFKLNEQRRISSEVNKESERLTQSWRVEIDNSRAGADEFTKAIQGLEKAYAKYSATIDPATRAELDQLAAQQRILKLTRERLVVLNQIRQRIVGDDIIRDLGGGSFEFRGEASRNRIATVGEQVTREREAMRLQEMREVAEDIGAIFGDVFDSIQGNWEDMWRDMARIAQNISRQIVQELFTALASRAFNVPFQSQSGGLVGGIINRILGTGRPASAVNLGGGSSFFPGGTGETRPRTVAGSRAGGGPVEAGLLYRVNEYRQEFFKPNQSGQVIPLGSQQREQSISRLFLVDDERAAYEKGAARREILRMGKQSRKIGKLVRA